MVVPGALLTPAPGGGLLNCRASVALGVLTALSFEGGCAPQEPSHESANPIVWQVGPHLPAPVSDNAVAALDTGRGVSVFSFLGMDSTRSPKGATNAAYRWDVGSGDGWKTVASVPGGARLGAMAQVVRGRVYILGGYTLARNGSEHSVPYVEIYDPSTNGWSRGTDMPLAVHDATSGVWRDSLVLVVGGRHHGEPVAAVQWYDPARDRWFSGTPIAGPPAVGAAGTVVGDRAIFTDGVASPPSGGGSAALDTAAWSGVVDPRDPDSILWDALPRHPGPVVYRAASGTLGGLAVFVGGASEPYGDDGMTPDGTPARPLRQVLAYDPGAHRWRHLPAPPVATMDHETLGVARGMVFLVGGMEVGPRVSDKVWYANVADLLTAP